MPFINPYNFARPSKAPVPRERGRGWDQDGGRSGVLTCTLTAETPLFVPGGTEAGIVKRFFEVRRPDGTAGPAIPGTSLKGALRCVTEAICGGCSPFGDGRVDTSLTRCNRFDALCPACRLYGFMTRGQRNGDVLRGRVAISDAIAETEVRPELRPVYIERSGTPKITHDAFYTDAGHHIRGRKFYWHQPDVTSIEAIPRRMAARPTRPEDGVGIHPVSPGATFSFRVRYNGLNDEELGLLLWTLLPGVGRRLKLGFGKGVGLGTVRIDVIRWETAASSKARYTDFDAEQPVADLAAGLSEAKSAFVGAYARRIGVPPQSDLFALPDDNLQDLGPLLTPQQFALPVRYPSYNWFRRMSQERLPTVAETLVGDGLPDLPP